YAIPLASVVEVARASASEVHRVDQHEVMQLREQVLTLVRMGQLVKHGPVALNKKIFVVVVALGDRKFGLIVDRLVGEEELVIKALDDDLSATELVSGASILGDGSVVLILNLSAVVTRLGKIPLQMEAVTA
ncbi:MAG TPA: chemotaxis protein CheW, partial [Terriglobales bacterium]|nr:chemotaxis protein CheW [Terriglobales bacterium]